MQEIRLMGPRIISIGRLDMTEEYRDLLVEEIYKLVGPEDYKTNLKARMTSYTVYKESKLFEDFLKRASEASKGATWMAHPLEGFPFRFIVDDLWGAVYRKGDHAQRHHHLPASFSFVYYLKTNSNCSPLIFDELNYTYTPVEDEFVIFPADLIHHVPQHTDDEDRVIIAGNLVSVLVEMTETPNERKTSEAEYE